MASGIKISQLPAANALTGAESIAVVQSGATRRTTVSTIVQSGSLSVPVTYVDRSGTITLGGTSQVLAPANGARAGFWIQNQSNGDLWLSSLAAASAQQPSLWLPPGAYYEFPAGGVPATTISIWGAIAGQPFAAREW